MKILIAIGMLIVFISVFFILLVGGAMFDEAFDCTQGKEKTVCSYAGLDSVSALGVFIIAFFIMIDILTVYLVLTNIRE